MRRFLDVLCQHWRWLAAGLVLVPSVLGVGTFGMDHTRVVVASVRVQPASFVADALPDVFLGVSPSRGTPAVAAANLIDQLVATDWFVAGVLSGGDFTTPGVSRQDDRRAEIADVHRHLDVASGGVYLVTLRYSTEQPARGMAFVTALLRKLGDAFMTVQAERAAAAAQVAASAQQPAKDDMQRAIAEVHRYAASFGDDVEALPQDPTFLRLAAAAQSATTHYQRLVALAQNSVLASAALSELRRQTAFVADQPSLEPGTRVGAAARAWLLGGVAVAAVGLLCVYVVALYDPRLRSVDDVRDFTDGPCLVLRG